MTQELIELGVSDAYLAELEEQWAIVPDCSVTAGYNAVTLGLSKIRKARTGIEKKRKLITKPLLDRKKAVDFEAKRLTAKLVSIEDPLKNAKQAEDNRLEMIKQEEIREEAARQERITAKIASFGNIVLTSLNGTADDIEEALNDLRGIDTDDCDERKDVADKSLEAAIESLESTLESKRAADELKRREDEFAAKEKAQAEEAERQKTAAAELEAKEARQKALEEAKEEERKADAAKKRPDDSVFDTKPFGGMGASLEGAFSGRRTVTGVDFGAGDDSTAVFEPESHRSVVAGCPSEVFVNIGQTGEAIEALMGVTGLNVRQAESVVVAIVAKKIPWVSWTGDALER